MTSEAQETDVRSADQPDPAAEKSASGPARRAELGPGSPLISNAGGWAVPLLLVALFIVFSIAAPDTFFTTQNINVMIGGQATTLLLAMAVIVPLRAGDFDLSVSSLMILSACVVGVLTSQGHSAWVACGAALLVGPLVGLVNGLLVVRFGIDSLIATLGTLTIMTGLASLVSGGGLIFTLPSGLTDFASWEFLGFSTPVWAGWVIALALWYVFEFTPLGRYLLFIGGNRDSAYLAGLRVERTRWGAFVVSGTLAAVAGLLFSGALGSVDPTAGGAYLLPPITAAFLGASVIQLGRFNIVGTLVAIYLLAVGITGLQLLGLDTWVANVFNGACLIAAVGASILFQRASARRAS